VNISAIVETIDLSGDDSWSSVYEQTMDLKFVFAVVYFVSLSLIIMFPMNIIIRRSRVNLLKGLQQLDRTHSATMTLALHTDPGILCTHIT
jgi:hypothetical protein